MPVEYIVSIADGDRDFHPMSRVPQSAALYSRRSAVEMAIERGDVSSSGPVLVVPSNGSAGEGSLYQVVEDVSPPVLVVEGCPRRHPGRDSVPFVVMTGSGESKGRVEFRMVSQDPAPDRLGAVYVAIDSGAISKPGPVLVGYPDGSGFYSSFYSDPTLFQVVEQPGSTALRVE